MEFAEYKYVDMQEQAIGKCLLELVVGLLSIIRYVNCFCKLTFDTLFPLLSLQ